MALRIFNARTRRVEAFLPIDPSRVQMYCCGPTVYDYAHIGNLRTYVFEDILRRTLELFGYTVKHVTNITDVGHLQSDADAGDDKIEIAARREHKSPRDIARHYEDEFFRHADLMRIKRPTLVCRATEHIDEMIDMVSRLMKRGHAYVVDGNVYFEVATFPAYADFAGLDLQKQKATNRVELDPRKRDAADFVLWFSQSKYPNQVMKWPSPWGTGFPGWHIECSAMASKYLGEHFDIHCGGIDHIPVHHTNEIAQSECCHGRSWVNFWLHAEFLEIDKDKMSKSTHGFLQLDQIVADGFTPLDYRYLLLTAHYRSRLRFSYDSTGECETITGGTSQPRATMASREGRGRHTAK
jgi:cysteinyl-tRNA synthetase